MSTTIISNDLIPEQEEIQSKEYLGTFRWKKSLQFIPLSPITSPINYSSLTKWSEFISQRINQEQFEPYILDGLSYPLSIIYALNKLLENKIISKDILSAQNEINVVILGASSKQNVE